MMMDQKSLISALVALLSVIAVARPSSAYVTFGQGYGSKWGAPLFGTPGTVTWGYMLDTTTADPNFRMDPWGFPNSTGVVGTSNITELRQRVDASHGAGAFDAAIQRAFDTWSTVADVTFVGPLSDSGRPFASPGATIPDIRIGAFTPQPGHSFNNVGAVGFGPPGPFGNDPLAGDIIFNLGAQFFVASGTEDQTALPPFGNDLEGLMAHEIGHAGIGLGHPSWAGANPDQRLMYVGDWQNPSAPFCCQTINRFPAGDDIAGAQYVYGLPGSTDLPGDVDRDGDVDRKDAAMLVHSFGKESGSVWTRGDFDGDRKTTLKDWALLQTHFGATATSHANVAVPEPSSAALAAMLIGALYARRRVACFPATSH
jgi:hypothetical protein